MLVKIYPENPDFNQIQKVVTILKNGGVIIYPTDTVYALGCDITKNKAIERIARIKGLKTNKAQFSFVCYDFSHLSDFIMPINNSTFKIMKSKTPGPFTFILKANNKVPKLLKSNRKTVGVRIPDNNIAREIVKELGHPIISTSLRDDDNIAEYSTDPELMVEKYQNDVDLVIDGGYGDNMPSTVVDFTQDEIKIIRHGKGIFE